MHGSLEVLQGMTHETQQEVLSSDTVL
jgi:hypothetical protein